MKVRELLGTLVEMVTKYNALDYEVRVAYLDHESRLDETVPIDNAKATVHWSTGRVLLYPEKRPVEKLSKKKRKTK